MTIETVKEIENALKLHINYKGVPSNGKYLKIMDLLSLRYSGAPGVRVSSLLDDYFKHMKVSNLNEALQRLRDLENKNNK